MRFLVSMIMVWVVLGAVNGLARDVDEEPRQAGPEVFPPRLSPGPTGNEFVKRTEMMAPQEREDAIYREVMRGNVPDHLKRFIPIFVSHLTAEGRVVNATVYVLPDYLAIGTNDDFVRIPMNFNTARRLAKALGFMLPTRKIVDAIYQQADIRLDPQPLGPGPGMCTSAAYLKHNQRINRQAGDAADAFALLAGHKKDVVISASLAHAPDQIAIYGWHRADDEPIQHLSIAHGANYVDYSHGVRFISETVVVDGTPHSLFDVLETLELAPVLSYDGVYRNLRRIMHRISEPPSI